jgi:N-terminal region of glycosyl transferase group 7
MSLSRVTCKCYLIQIAKWLLIFSTFIYLVHPGRFAVPNYPSIKQEDIEKHLVEFQHEPNSCNFSITKSDDFLLYPSWSEEADLESVDNGQWAPKHCKAKYETTIIVPYR